MRWAPYVLLSVLGCQEAPEQKPESAPSTAAAPVPSQSALPFTRQVFADIKAKLATLTPADACFETCRVTAVCRPSAAAEADAVAQRVEACRTDCNADLETWKPRVAQARVCLAGPDCDAFDVCMRGSGLAPASAP